MPYNPTIIPSQGLGPGINAISGLVEDWQKKQQEEQRLMGYNDAIIQHAHAAGRISQEELNKYQSAKTVTQKTGIAAGYAANLHDDLQQQKLEQQKQMDFAQLANAIEVAKIHAAARGGAGGVPFEPKVYPLTDPGTGQTFSVFSRGPHQVDLTPGSQPGGIGAAPFKPDEATMQAMGEAGYTFAPQSNKAGHWINTAGNKPDLDENGNPKFTPDGSAYIAGGKVKPLTPEMRNARDAYNEQQKQAGNPPATKPGWFDSWFGGGSKAQPAPAAVAAAPDLKALAQRAINDPRATPEQKAAARKILGQ
jgi:hypothetical protein